MCMCKYPFNLNLQYKHLKQSFYIKTCMFCDIFYYFGKKGNLLFVLSCTIYM